MLLILSPSKTMDFKTPVPAVESTQPLFLKQAQELVSYLKQMSAAEIRELMQVSGPLAVQTKTRFMEWSQVHTSQNARQSVFAFSGDVYDGLDVSSLIHSDIIFSQKHMIILSGLYGLLRPLDLMMPFRLEMGLKWETEKFSNLYEYWKKAVNESFFQVLNASGSNTVVNLASLEYFKILELKKSSIQVVTPSFLEFKDGKMKMVSIFAKKARGMMARFIITNKITDPLEMTAFSDGGYAFIPEESDEKKLIFAR